LWTGCPINDQNMAITLQLKTDETGGISAFHEGRLLAGPTARAELPALEFLQANPFDQGMVLTAALGGHGALARLMTADPDNLILLEADKPAGAIPWEFAAVPGNQLLGCMYGLLRLVEQDGALPATPDEDLAEPGPPQFITLAADPLVDKQGRPREGYRLNTGNEPKAIRRTLAESKRALQARRIPPTRQALHRSLQRGPAVLRLVCHGGVIETKEHGPLAVLFLEDDDGVEEPLLGRDLVAMSPAGNLRLLLLGGCHTAKGDQVQLAQTLVGNGIPAAAGTHSPFPHPLSDALAADLYAALLAGSHLGEALRQARLALLAIDAGAAGLPAGCVNSEGWRPLPLKMGHSEVHILKSTVRTSWPREIRPPRKLYGRNGELHRLAQMYNQKRSVVTVIGSGGVGKTALAANFAERFAWRWPQGAFEMSFAGGKPDAARFRRELIRALFDDAAAQELSMIPAESQSKSIVDALRKWDGLLLLDSYDSILQALVEPDAEQVAREIHHLVSQLAANGANLLLTSRRSPAALPNETLFPGEDHSLEGLPLNPAARLFLDRSSRAREANAPHRQLARDVAQTTDGHPLAIHLLAGEFDRSEVEPADFLAGWVPELVAAELTGAESEGEALTSQGLTLRVAFERSYGRLPEALQERLRALSIFPFPFLAEGAALVWGMTAEEEYVAAAGHDLSLLAEAGLLDVSGASDDASDDGNLPTTYQLHQALLPEINRLVTGDERPALRSGVAAYGAWLARRGDEETDRERDLLRLSSSALEAATGELEGTERLWHLRRLAWLHIAYGETQAAYNLLLLAWPDGIPPPDPEEDREQASIISNLHYELAQICTGRGELDRALSLYEESVQLTERIGNLEGKSAALSGAAGIHMARENWEAAEEKLVESLNLAEQLNWTEAVAADTVKLGQVAQARGDLEMSLERYHEGLALYEQLDMPHETERLEELIATLPASAVSEPPEVSRLAQLAAEARTAAQNGRFDRAVEVQKEAVALAREHDDSRDSLVALTVQLYYLAIYQGRVKAYGEAVGALEEAYDLARRTGYEQIERIREALEGARESAAQSPEEQAELKAVAARRQMDNIADQTRDAAIAALRGEVDRETLAARLDDVVARAGKEAPGSPRAELATFVGATAALLRGEPAPAVPDAYTNHMKAIEKVAKELEQEPGA
jgi:tetratricopeptide (TPR) repeat protein